MKTYRLTENDRATIVAALLDSANDFRSIAKTIGDKAERGHHELPLIADQFDRQAVEAEALAAAIEQYDFIAS